MPRIRTQINHELDDLHDRDVLLPPDANATSTLEVVPVHDHVHQEVQTDHNPRNRSRADQLGVAQQGRGTVMISVEERQGLLLED